MGDGRRQVPIYFPQSLYEWLVQNKARGQGSLSEQVVSYCQEARIRAELDAAAAAGTVVDADALAKIRERIAQREDRAGPG